MPCQTFNYTISSQLTQYGCFYFEHSSTQGNKSLCFSLGDGYGDDDDAQNSNRDTDYSSMNEDGALQTNIQDLKEVNATALCELFQDVDYDVAVGLAIVTGIWGSPMFLYCFVAWWSMGFYSCMTSCIHVSFGTTIKGTGRSRWSRGTRAILSVSVVVVLLLCVALIWVVSFQSRALGEVVQLPGDICRYDGTGGGMFAGNAGHKYTDLGWPVASQSNIATPTPAFNMAPNLVI